MKKAGMGLLVLFFCCCLMLTGCGASSKGEPSLVVYSFKGEKELKKMDCRSGGRALHGP